MQFIRRFVLLLVVVFALAACGDATPTQANSPTTTPTHAPTTHPTQAPVGIPPASGPALLGSSIGTFVAAYGQPNNHTDSTNGGYHFARIPGQNVDSLIVNTDLADGGVYQQRVDDITAAAGDPGWSTAQANQRCGVFYPRDAVYKSQVAVTGGYDKIYFSQSLASLFPASAFTDARQNPVKAGYFDVLFLYHDSSDTAIDDCDLIIGEQQTT